MLTSSVNKKLIINRLKRKVGCVFNQVVIFKKIKKHYWGTGNKIIHYKATLFNVIFNIRGNNNTIQIEEGCSIKNVTFEIFGDNHSIRIKKNCLFFGGNIWFEDNNGALEIDEGSKFFGKVGIAVVEPRSSITIGKNCLFAPDVDVRTSDSHSIFDIKTGCRINHAKNIKISNCVWIGMRSIILKGANIDENSVVAAGSVILAGNYPSESIIAGNPGKVVKNGVRWSIKREGHYLPEKSV